MPLPPITWSTAPQDGNFDNPNNWIGPFTPTSPSFLDFGNSSITSLTFPSGEDNSEARLTFEVGAPAYSFTIAANTAFTFVALENDSSNTESFSVTGSGAQLNITGSIFNSGSGGEDLLVGDNGTISFSTFTLVDGTLQFGDGGALVGSIIGSVTDDATLAIDCSDIFTFGASISGTGVFQQIGTGTTILTAAESYSGGTTISAGTLQLGNGVTDGSITGNVTDDGTFIDDDSGTYNLSGAISGSGGFEQIGTGTTILTAAESYTGGTTVSAGTLETEDGLYSGGALTIDGGTVEVGLRGLSVGDLSGTGGTLNMMSSTLTVGTADSTTFSGEITGGLRSSVDKVGTGTLTLAGSNIYADGIAVEDGTLLIDGSSANADIAVESGGALGGSGTAGLVTVEAGGTFAPGDPSTFTVASLTLDSGATFDEQIGGTAPGTGGAGGYDQTVVESGGAVALGGATLDVSLVNSFTPSTGESFTIIDNETGDPVSGTFDGLAQGAVFEAGGTWFQISYDGGANNQDVTVTDVACYCRGTLIHTKCGNKRVEKLQIGDEVMTASGAARPIKWIGRRSYGGRFVMGRKDILPVCIKAGALDDNVPKRDLWISPHHAMYFGDEARGGVSIEAKDLLNGVSIVQAERIEKVEYFHIELDTHDVIVAEGALSESFIEDDSRGMFHNAHEYDTLYADEHAASAHYCAPRHDEGYEVEAARRGIAQRAGLLRAADGPRTGELRGYIDLVSETCIAGWAQNADHPEAPVCLDIYAGGHLIGQVVANTYRDDLKRAGLGSGRHAFIFTPPADFVFAPDAVEVRRSLDGASLPPSAHAIRTPASTAA